MRREALLIALLFAPIGTRADQEPPKTLSLDTGYIPPLATNHSMKNLWLEYEGLGAGVFDFIGNHLFLGKTVPTRALYPVAMFFVWGYANYGFYVANHELGHGTRFLAEGFTPNYQWSGSGGSPSILPFILQGYFKYGQGADTYVTGGSGRTYPADWNTVVYAAGMNNSMMFAETLEDEVYYNTGHINQFRAYVYGKLDAYNYARTTESGGVSDGDVQNELSAWQAHGYSIAVGDIALGGGVALLASSTTYFYAFSFLKYIATGDPTVSAWSLGGFKLPDVSFFQNRYGISYRVRSAAALGDHVFPFSVEYLYKGSPRAEVSLGYRLISPIDGIRKTGALVQGYVSSVGGVGARVSKDFPASPNSFLTLGASIFSVNSLEGERNLGVLLNSELGAELWGKLTWRL